MAKTKKNSLKKYFQLIKRPLLIVFVIYTVFFPVISQSATMGVQALIAQVAPDKNFSIRVSVNTQGKTINNAEATINFPTDLVQVVSVSSGGIFSLWVEPPAFSNSAGTISFNGGVPNPGFSGSGQVMTAVFKAKKVGTAKFSLSGTAIRENDGLGTNILTGQSGGSILIIEEKKPEPDKKPEVIEKPDQPTIDRVIITSPTHPDNKLWYKESKAIFNWRLPSGSTATQTSFDQKLDGTPSVVRRPAVSTLTIDTLTDGVWYFHARFQVGKNWSPVYTYKIQVDVTPPENLNVVVRNDIENRLSAVMTATDKNSGIAYYTVQIDSQLPVTVPSTQNETIALLPPMSKGKHVITVVAFDKAGNSTAKPIDFENVEEEKITITKYDKEIQDNDQIKIFGSAPVDTVLRVSLSTQEGLIRYYYIKSQANGDFNFLSEPIAAGGKYTLWVEREASAGETALISDRIEIIAKDSFWMKLRFWFINLKNLITWTNIIILTLFLLGLYGWYKYFRLRRYLNKNSEKNGSVKTFDEVVKNIKK